MNSLDKFTRAIACTCYSSIVGERSNYHNFQCRVQGAIIASVELIDDVQIVKLASCLQSSNLFQLYSDCQDVYKDTSIEQVYDIVSLWISNERLKL